MYACNFEYDGQYLSDYGFIICDFNSTSGADIASAGSKITFNKVSQNRGRHFSLTSTQYDECIQTTFDICKNPDVYNQNDMKITQEEYRVLMRWLNRKEFLPFRVLNEDEYDFCYYNASFNVDKIKIGEVLYGLELTLESDKPFGYGKEQINVFDIKTAGQSFLINDVSDEIGFTYPYVKITCGADGDLILVNDLLNCVTVINNCRAGEVITLDNQSQIITTSYNTHDICDDFNYEFFKIGNAYSERGNRIAVSLPCKLEIKYSPIIKDSP